MKNKPIKILFDANPIVNGNKSGVGYYSYYLLEAFAKNHLGEVNIVAHYFNFLGRKNPNLPKVANINYKQSRFLPGKILSLTRKFGFQVPLEIFFKTSGDIAIFTNFVSLPNLSNVPTFVAVHDLCYEDVPEYVSDKNRAFLHRFVPKSIKSVTKIITISESTKSAIKKHYGVNDNKFIITPIPPQTPLFTSKDVLKRFEINKKYILLISNLEPRKNFINLVKAYEKLPKNIKKEYCLVLAGGKGWKIEEQLNYIENSKFSKDIILTGYVSDVERAALYTNASIFVMPSHYEGFGMPVLEAMSYGIPTAISDIPVFHEVAGDASEYFDKDNPSEITKTIQKILDNKKLQQNLISKGNKQLKKYSWEKVAFDLYEEIKKVIN